MTTLTLSLIDGATGRFSAWLDASYPDDMNVDLVTYRRVGKVIEEVGEVASAVGGYFGENPRKGITHTLDDLQGELLDVAFAALGAWEHLDGNPRLAATALLTHVRTADEPTFTADASDVHRLNAYIAAYNDRNVPVRSGEPVELTLRRRVATLSRAAGLVAEHLDGYTHGHIGTGSLQRRLLDVAAVALATHDATAERGTAALALYGKAAFVLTRVGLPAPQ